MKCLTAKNLEISPAFVLLLCLFFYADPWGLFGPFLLAAFCHELGHVVACWAVGAPVQQLRIGFGGALPCPIRQSVCAHWPVLWSI